MGRQGHIAAFDVIRVVSMCFVVAVHSLVMLDASWVGTWPVTACGQGIFFTANAMFFMLSGRFNLRECESSTALLAFYFKKFRGIGIPVVTLFLLRTIWDMRLELTDPIAVLKRFARNLLGDFSATEYWFMFTLVGYLIISPFLAHIITRFREPGHRFELRPFMILCVLFNGASFVAANLDMRFSWTMPFVGYLFPYCLGPLIDEWARDNRVARWLCVGGAFGVIATSCLSLNGWGQGVHDISPFYTLAAVGIYVFLFRLGGHLKSGALFSTVAPHAFSVYMVHMVVLGLVSSFVAPLPGALSLVTYAVTLVLTIAGSLLVAVVLDKTVIALLQNAFDRIVMTRIARPQLP